MKEAVSPTSGVGIEKGSRRAINPITETNWEGSGVEPDVQVSADKAFDRAYTLALEEVRDNTEQARKEELDWLIEYRGKWCLISAVSAVTFFESASQFLLLS